MNLTSSMRVIFCKDFGWPFAKMKGNCPCRNVKFSSDIFHLIFRTQIKTNKSNTQINIKEILIAMDVKMYLNTIHAYTKLRERSN